jgi:hypothetical protein
MVEMAVLAPVAVIGTVALVLWWERKQLRAERRRK